MKRNISLDILKVIMSIFVVLLHLKFMSAYSQNISDFFVNGLFRVAVPVFLIINGYFLNSTFKKNTFTKTLMSLLKIYFLWMLIYSYFWLRQFNGADLLITVFFGYHILWYFPGLIFSSIILYLIRNKNSITIAIISTLCYLIGYTMQIILYKGVLLGDSNDQLLKIIMYRNFLFDCLPLISTGYLISRGGLANKVKNTPILLVCGVLLLILETTLNDKYFGASYQSDIMISTPLLSMTLFIIALNLIIKSKLESKKISQFATSVFLVHVLCINIINKLLHRLECDNAWVLYFGVLSLSFILSFLIIHLKKNTITYHLYRNLSRILGCVP